MQPLQNLPESLSTLALCLQVWIQRGILLEKRQRETNKKTNTAFFLFFLFLFLCSLFISFFCISLLFSFLLFRTTHTNSPIYHLTWSTSLLWFAIPPPINPGIGTASLPTRPLSVTQKSGNKTTQLLLPSMFLLPSLILPSLWLSLSPRYLSPRYLSLLPSPISFLPSPLSPLPSPLSPFPFPLSPLLFLSCRSSKLMSI